MLYIDQFGKLREPCFNTEIWGLAISPYAGSYPDETNIYCLPLTYYYNTIQPKNDRRFEPGKHPDDTPPEPIAY